MQLCYVAHAQQFTITMICCHSGSHRFSQIAATRTLLYWSPVGTRGAPLSPRHLSYFLYFLPRMASVCTLDADDGKLHPLMHLAPAGTWARAEPLTNASLSPWRRRSRPLVLVPPLSRQHKICEPISAERLGRQT